MGNGGALLYALDLAKMPAMAARARAMPLPEDVLEVIRIASGDSEAIEAAVQRTRKDASFIKSACEYYLHQVLLFPDAGAYRILGISPGASRQEARAHLRWLMKWLHPDHGAASWQVASAQRVLAAWNEVSSKARLEEIEGSAVAAVPSRGMGGGPQFSVHASLYPAAGIGRMTSAHTRIPWVPRPITGKRAPIRKSSRLRKLVYAALGLMAAMMLPSIDAQEALSSAIWLICQFPDSVGASSLGSLSDSNPTSSAQIK
ncbi:MAG: hypothetical protein CTY15_13180 [Methylocystis sp.]|nr:MAG: hypothetical protein CTY15_13180 [Methylocystis sp.]